MGPFFFKTTTNADLKSLGINVCHVILLIPKTAKLYFYFHRKEFRRKKNNFLFSLLNLMYDSFTATTFRKIFRKETLLNLPHQFFVKTHFYSVFFCTSNRFEIRSLPSLFLLSLYVPINYDF